MNDKVDIWSIPLNPTPAQLIEIQTKHGFWKTGIILKTRQWLEDNCPGARPKPDVDTIVECENLTIEQLRSKGLKYFSEADRLIALPERKKLYALRCEALPDPLFIDKEEDPVRYWALQHPRPDAWLYMEEWAKDGEKWHILNRERMDNPVETANQNGPNH